LKKLFAEVGAKAGTEKGTVVGKAEGARAGDEEARKFAYEEGARAGAEAARKKIQKEAKVNIPNYWMALNSVNFIRP